MTRSTDFLHRPSWSGGMVVYPLLALVLAVYLYVAPSNDEGAAPFNAAPQESATSVQPLGRAIGVVPAVAAPISGVTRKGAAYIMWRSETGPVREFQVTFPANRDKFGYPRL